MPYLVLGVAILVGVLLLGRWYVNAEPGKIVKVVRWSAIVIVGATIVFFGVTGKIVWALYALPILLPWFLRYRAIKRAASNWSKMKNAARGSTSGASNIETRYLRVNLDHQSGAMSGEVLTGRYQGRKLDSMSLDELIDLLGECNQAGDESAQVLASYLERHHADDWRERAANFGGQQGAGAGGGPGGGGSSMTREEAYEVLGVEPGATKDDIKEAHKRLLSKIHPDHGGSTYLAAKINQAKDLLLGG